MAMAQYRMMSSKGAYQGTIDNRDTVDLFAIMCSSMATTQAKDVEKMVIPYINVLLFKEDAWLCM